MQAPRPTLSPILHTPYASAGRDPYGPHIVTDVCIHNPDNTNNCELVSAEAHYSTSFLSQQYGLGLVNLSAVELQPFKSCSCNDESDGRWHLKYQLDLRYSVVI